MLNPVITKTKLRHQTIRRTHLKVIRCLVLRTQNTLLDLDYLNFKIGWSSRCANSNAFVSTRGDLWMAGYFACEAFINAE